MTGLPKRQGNVLDYLKWQETDGILLSARKMNFSYAPKIQYAFPYLTAANNAIILHHILT